jgi:hypothetical protein
LTPLVHASIRPRTFADVIVLCFASLLTSANWSAFGQCVNPPTLKAGEHWPNGQRVYYTISSSITGAELAGVQAGIAAWSQANQSNGTDNSFAAADTQHPAVLTIVNDSTANGNFGWMTPTFNANGTIASAIISIYINATISPGVRVFDSSQPGYSMAIQKAVMHETGHTMGLDNVLVLAPLKRLARAS